MKRCKHMICLVLTLVLTVAFAGTAFASDGGTKTVRMLCYNVAGLPAVSGLMGMQGVSVPENQTVLGNLLNRSNYDVIAVQEDFNYHARLSRGLTGYRYKTLHSGGVPGGDGLNVFSKFPLYDTRRTPWDQAHGLFDDGDELTPKGILYTVLDLGDGVYADFYNIHADAFADAGSVAARNDNFRQLSELIESRDTGRPVIVTGDFNTSTHLEDGADFTAYMIRNGGFKDAWTELHHGGDYEDYTGLDPDDYWGKWDSVEKFLYRDGDGVSVRVESFGYTDFKNGTRSISDHKAAEATVTFTKTGPVAKPAKCRTPISAVCNAITNKITYTVKDLKLVLTHLNDLIAILHK